jgi:methyl-accepting chemotaxis protein
MSVWKKILIYAGIAVLLFGIGFGAATAIFGSTTADLRERVKDITAKYDAATEAQREAVNTVTKLEQRNRETEDTVSRLAKQVEGLSATNTWLRNRITDLEGSIEIISAGLRDITDSATESGGLIQESLRILLGISERSNKTN